VQAPEAQQCIDLLRGLGASGRLLRHVILVSRAASALAGLCGAEPRYCEAAALLHDLGKTPRAALLASRKTGQDPDSLARLDHGLLGAIVLGCLGDPFSGLSPAVERHVISCVLAGPGPVTPEEQVVFLADKMAGMAWMGFRARTLDIVRRHGHKYDVAAAVPGAQEVFWNLSSRACLGPCDLEALVRDRVLALDGPYP